MEPEMSQSTTSRRGRIRGARRANRIASPPLRRASRSVRRRSGRFPSRAGRYLRVRPGGTASVISRMSTISCRSSAGDSWVKSRPRSCSLAEATRRTAGPSASGSSASAAAGTASVTRRPDGMPPGSPWDGAAGWGPPSWSARWNVGMTGGTWFVNGDGPPNSAANTRSKVAIWPGSDTIVASAQARSSATEVAPMTVTARASRSQRSGPTGSPAVCRAIPRPVASEATSGPVTSGRVRGPVKDSVKGADHRRQAGPAHRFLVFRVLEHRADGLARQPLPQLGHPAPDDLGDAGGVRVGDPVVQAAALEGVVQVPGPVRGQHGDRGQGRPLGAELGNGDRRLGQQLEQEGLELVVGPVHLVDEQHGRAGTRVQQGGEQRPWQQILAGEQVLVLDVLAGRLGEPDGEQLARVVPLVQRF